MLGRIDQCHRLHQPMRVRLVSMSSLVNTTVYAYRMFLRDFDHFEKYGPNALRVLFLLLAYSHMQQRNNKFLPVKNDYRWVRFSNRIWGKDPSKKSKILKKLHSKGLVLIQREKGKSEKSNPLVRLKEQTKQRTKNLKFGYFADQQSNADKGFKFSKLVGKLRSKKYGN